MQMMLVENTNNSLEVMMDEVILWEFRKIIEWFKNYAKKQEDKIPKYLSGKRGMME